MHKTLIVIAGPTAIGKTGIAIKLAQHFITEIVSADSRQCYEELNIGVARPSETELNLVQHHLIASHSIKNPLDVATYISNATACLDAIFAKNNVAILVGGTGLYINGLLNGIDEIPEIDAQIKLSISESVKNNGIDWLVTALQKADPEFIAKHPELNNYRYQRALGIALTHNKSISSFQLKLAKPLPYNVIGYHLQTQRNLLYQNINNRVLEMIDDGLEKEVRALLKYKDLKVLQTIGYKETFSYLNDEITKTEMIDKIQQHTRNYAKRQITWFNNQTNFTPILNEFNLVLANIKAKL